MSQKLQDVFEELDVLEKALASVGGSGGSFKPKVLEPKSFDGSKSSK